VAGECRKVTSNVGLCHGIFRYVHPVFQLNVKNLWWIFRSGLEDLDGQLALFCSEPEKRFFRKNTLPPGKKAQKK
jgi:hypothetical protein